MGDRKWEDLPVDCLVNIFTRVGLVSLAEDVPYVCKSWYKATLSPLCWQSLMFHDLSDLKILSENFEELSTGWISLFKEFVKSVIRRSRGSANVVTLSPITEEIVNCVAEGCPSLKKLILQRRVLESRPLNISSMICKWKDLETLVISTGHLLKEILSQISIHCKKFKSLGIIDVHIVESEASGIASLLPNIEYLYLKHSRIKRSNLIIILKGCKKLVHLDVSNCIGFDVDEEIQSLAAHIATFNFEGSRLGCNHFEVVDELFNLAANLPTDIVDSMLEFNDEFFDDVDDNV